ncbi:MAG: VIT domain-containing protein, partial [Methanococcaceae archaeon]
MFYKFFFPFIALLSCTTICNATGLMMPVSKSYPKDFLRLRSTEVSVKISGLVAETSVYEEFQNEWSDSTDAVFSFPLPADARATDIVYWYNDKVYKAILQVKEQSTNPGTGEGGLAAEVNKYIGTNGIKFLLKGIKAGAIQRIELHYISFLDYFQGKNSYSFPLNTGDFVKYPVDNVKFNFNINSNSTIKNFTIPGYSDYKTIESTSNTYKARLEKPKIYLDQDLSIIFETDNSKMGVDFFSTAGDSADGHFAIFVRPQIQAASDSILKKSTIFLLSTSGGILGVQFEASKTAISQGLDKLSTKDYFNIVMANYYISNWKPAPVAATAENIQLAKTFLSAATTGYGSNLQEAVKQALSQLKDSTFNTAILMFTESGSNLDPLAIEKLNTLKTGIFPIGIGDQVSRARLEMTAAY